jgi:hypothetical protein
MIDWLSVVAHGFWIAGLALILAALSYHYWLAEQTGHSLREQFGGVSFQRVFVIGLLLVGMGLSGVSRQPWQLALSAAVVIASAVTLALLWRAAA